MYFFKFPLTAHQNSVCCISAGKYIFEEPLQHYWAEKRAEEIAAAKASPPSASTISSDKTK